MRHRGRRAVWWIAGVAALPAVVLTTARIVGGSHRRLAIAQAFAPWAIPAYLLVVLLLALLLLRPSSQRPSRRSVGVAIGAAGAALALHLSWLAPSIVGDAPEADPDAQPMTVMTANLRFGEADPADVVAAVADQDVDLLVLQEIDPPALAALEAAGLGQALPHRAGRAEPGALGTMAFSRTAVADVERIGTQMGSWAFTTAGLRVLAVHPAYPLDADWSAELVTVRRAVEDLEPDVVLGDFNASVDHAPFRAILHTGLRDAAELVGAGWQPTWPTEGFRGWPVPASVAIDHVLVDDDLTATATATVRIDGTDHRALVATVVTRRPAR